MFGATASSSSAVVKPRFEYKLEARKYRNPEFGEMGTQYCHLYHVRLHELKPSLLAAVEKKWPGVKVLSNIALVNLADCKIGDSYVVLGTLMKKFKKRESVFEKGKLKEVISELTDRTEKWASPEDILSIHDDTSSIHLCGTVDPGEFVTGLVVAVKGHKSSKTSPFHVEDTCLPGSPSVYKSTEQAGGSASSTGAGPMDIDGETAAAPSGIAGDKSTGLVPLPFRSQMRSDGVYCAFVSGPLLARKEALGVLFERLSSDPKIAHLVLAGNTYSNTLSKIKKADGIFAAFGKLLSVDILPGFRDTHVVSFPLERPAPMLFPESSQNANIQGVPSPYDALLGSVRVLGHAGEPTEDIQRCSAIADTLDALKLCLESRHIAPTCPDTLNCASFKDVDPLLMQDAPQLFFAGGQSTARAARYRDQTTLLCIPDIRKQAALVLVNINDATDVVCELLEFN
ncbi:unnamed protein product [Amoebophrya sp. A25]|nr:unnamed protein product [Amoebophrya sp. A25]|eukprot:GSA25T00013629001.1